MRRVRHLWENRFSRTRLIIAGVAALACAGGILHGIRTGLGSWSTEPEIK